MKKNPSPNKDWVEHTLPASLKVGYQDIKITEVDLIDGQGVYIADRSEIRIREGMEKREQLNTLLHESLHALCYSYGLKNEFKDDDHEERVVNALGNGLTEILVRNPQLVKCIIANAKA